MFPKKICVANNVPSFYSADSAKLCVYVLQLHMKWQRVIVFGQYILRLAEWVSLLQQGVKVFYFPV